MSSACAADVRERPAEAHDTEIDANEEQERVDRPEACPSSELYLTDGCSHEGITCSYTYDDVYACIMRNYTCAQGSWTLVEGDCSSPGCPADKPELGTSCDSEGMHCRYPGHYCPHLLAEASCDEGAWSIAEPECGNEPWNGGMGTPWGTPSG